MQVRQMQEASIKQGFLLIEGIKTIHKRVQVLVLDQIYHHQM